MTQSLGIAITLNADGTATVDPAAANAAAYLNDARGGFSDDEIKAAFDLVKNADHWKNPIDAVIDRSSQDVVAVAIAWYTATPAEFEDTDEPDKVRVTAVGYFDGPAGP